MSTEQPNIAVPVETVALPIEVIVEMPKNDGEIGAQVIIPIELPTVNPELKDFVK